MTTQAPRRKAPRRAPWLRRAPTAGLAAIYVAALVGMAPPSAAAQAPAAGTPTPPAAETPAPPAADTLAPPIESPAPPPGNPSSPPAAGTPAPPATGAAAPPAAKVPGAPDALDGVSAGMTAAKLLLVDVREVFRSPEHWHRGEWALFGLEAAAVIGVGAADESLQRDVLRSRSSSEDKLAKDFRTFGNYGSFEVLGGFYIAGLFAHDKKAQETCLDGLFASGIAGGLVSPFLKLVIGRSRPNANRGAYDFHPFSGHNVSFPSGESTQAFAVASVISTQYPNPLVEILSYTTAALTSWGRVRQNGHWVSDTLAGAFIGYHVGRRVVHINQRLRARVSVNPSFGSNGRRGMMLTASF